MILFMIKKGSAPGRQPIPLHYSTNVEDKLTSDNVQFISWNEADYHLDDETIVQIINIDTLMKAVHDAAIRDIDVCGFMITQFTEQYGIDILKLWNMPGDPAYHIIRDVFVRWAHPMIGNMMISPGIRPQTYKEQYEQNWNAFPAQHMSESTKTAINNMLEEIKALEEGETSTAGLQKLTTSNRDQVRCCKDMTELARAVIGEITTYATKKLEKIYALELCQSKRFLAAQKAFVKCVVFDMTKKNAAVNPKLEKIFFSYNPRGNVIEVTEYIYFYFPKLGGLSRPDQWAAFISLINAYLDGDGTLPCDIVNPKANEIITACLAGYRKFPPVIRGAMIINAIRKFHKPPNKNRCALRLVDKSQSQWEIARAPVAPVIFTIPKPNDTGKQEKMFLWNWTRDETHPVTASYRKSLMPLWAGPSGHTAGLLDFYRIYLEKDFFLFERMPLPISLIILPTMFTFWRLYYDKRISAVHTLAETFDGALAHVLESKGSYGESYICDQVNAEVKAMCAPKMLEYEDVFDTIILLPDLSREIYNDTGVMHPVRIMAQIRIKHYNTPTGKTGIEKIDALNVVIDNLRGALTSQGYEVPRWAQPIDPQPTATSGEKPQDASGLSALEIRSFSSLNVMVFERKPPSPFPEMAQHSLMGNRDIALSMQTSRLCALYDAICACGETGGEYRFTEHFPALPECYLDAQRAPFLSDICFSDIRECSLAETAFTYQAKIVTDAPFWEHVKAVVPLADSAEIFCTVTETADGLHFAGEIAVEFVYRVTDKLSFAVHRVGITSGLDDVFDFPTIFLLADIAGQFDLTVVFSPDADRFYINGEYEEGRVLTIAGLLSSFGLDGVVLGSELLPDEESVFGSLGLRAVSLTVDTVSEGVTQIGFTVTAGKPWRILGDKITLQPYFDMNIKYPFDAGRRKVDYRVLGKWHIGSTVFDLMYRSDQTIYACLADDSTLRFADVAGLFAKDVSFPPVELTDMEFSADIPSGNYSLYLSAEHVLEFEVGQGKLGIEGLSFSLGFHDGQFGAVKLGGSFALGGVTLALTGSYSKDSGLTFKAMAYSDTDYSLWEFIAQAAQDFGQAFDKESVPDSLLAANIRMLTASYESGNKAFYGYVGMENVLVVSEDFAIRELALEISSEQGTNVAFQVIAGIQICGTQIRLTVSKGQEGFILSGGAAFTDLTFGRIAGEFGIAVGHLPDFLTEFAVTNLRVQYNFTTKEFALCLTTNAGKISADINAGGQSGWRISYETDSGVCADMLRMPLVGELVQKLAPGTTGLSVKDFVLEVSSAQGVIFKCTAFGSVCMLELYKPTQRLTKAAGNFAAPETVKWINLNKTFAILTVSKVGIGLDGSRVVVLLSASLAVSPFTFSLAEAGVGINVSRLSDTAFYLSGFGVAFDNGMLAISGSFSRKRREAKEVYAGSLLVKCKSVTVTAVGEYSSGSLFAYMALSAPIGGPPAFFVSGLALGFGYNRSLVLPSVEQVPDYPLIKAVKKGFDAQTLNELGNYIVEDAGQNFLAAGVRFTSFQIVDGFLLLSVSFGKKFKIGVLGLADISMPPHAPSYPVAKAQLAVRGEYDPSAGVFGVEARLTSESYILSPDCRLTGGFAAFFWFEGSEHSGDFVITLGGYHPAYRKPAHYPEVPRLGLNWNVTSHLNISGEIYFALTPGAAMAGGKLSAVYTLGKLRAWFIAYADFLVSWKPFAYQARIGVSLGASYRVDCWFVHKTFSVELAAALDLWGPEVQGRLHVSWFIISFTISFSKGADHSKETLDWRAFKESFLSDKGQNGRRETGGDTDILTVTVTGVCGQAADGTDIINPNGFGITLVSKIPEQGNVRPVNSAPLRSTIALTVEDEHKRVISDRFRKDIVVRNVPAALWKSAPAMQDRLREENMVKDARCGVSYELSSEVRQPELFPRSRFISLEELYRSNTLAYEDCFRFVSGKLLQLSEEGSIGELAKNADSAETRKRRQAYLADNGITEQVSIARFAQEAEDWLSEELLIGT